MAWLEQELSAHGVTEVKWSSVELAKKFDVARESVWRVFVKLEETGVVRRRMENRQLAFVSFGTGCEDATKEDVAFDRVWAPYPRKDAKIDARKAFRQIQGWRYVETIVEDVETRAWSPYKQFIPLLGTYLRGKRWMDEKGLNRAVYSLATDAEVEQAARSLNVAPKPGESYDQLRGRVRARMEAGR